jgi:hypothetical protein
MVDGACGSIGTVGGDDDQWCFHGTKRLEE